MSYHDKGFITDNLYSFLGEEGGKESHALNDPVSKVGPANSAGRAFLLENSPYNPETFRLSAKG